MDKMVYTAMTGARHIVEQQGVTANNLANATTTGFRAQLDAFRAVPLLGPGLPTRTMVVDTTMGADFKQGSLQATGRELDVGGARRRLVCRLLPEAFRGAAAAAKAQP